MAQALPLIRYREYFLQGGDGAVGFPLASRHPARISIGMGPDIASFSHRRSRPMNCSARANAAALSPRPFWSARDIQ